MIIEIEKVPKDVSLYKWHRVYSYKHKRYNQLYIRFTRAWDLQGNALDRLPANSHVITEAYFNTNEYP